jgi:universal stress protein A
MKRILVPLDLTADSEAVLSLVGNMARGAGATVRLLHVAPDAEALLNEHGQVVVYVEQEEASLEAAARDHLLAAAAVLEGIPVETTVRFGDPDEMIVREATDFGADVIVLSTRCRTGLGRFAPGGTTTHVCRAADCAVVLMRPEQAIGT